MLSPPYQDVFKITAAAAAWRFFLQYRAPVSQKHTGRAGSFAIQQELS